MTGFEVAAIALFCLVGPCLWICARRSFADALVAAQLVSTLAALALVIVSEAKSRQPFGDLGIVLAALSLVGSLVLVRFLERAE